MLSLIHIFRPGQTARLVNAGRLRLKECDRLAAIPEELNKLGGQLTEGADFLEIRGVERLLGGVADSHNDHRIAMMLALSLIHISRRTQRSDGPLYPGSLHWFDDLC